jgi:predicted regulator of amino acid metabolism with ACT domain
LCTNHPGQIGAIGTYLGNENVQIKQISIHDEQEESLRLKMVLRLPLTATPVDIIEGLKTVDGIKEIDS